MLGPTSPTVSGGHPAPQVLKSNPLNETEGVGIAVTDFGSGFCGISPPTIAFIGGCAGGLGSGSNFGAFCATGGRFRTSPLTCPALTSGPFVTLIVLPFVCVGACAATWVITAEHCQIITIATRASTTSTYLRLYFLLIYPYPPSTAFLTSYAKEPLFMGRIRFYCIQIMTGCHLFCLNSKQSEYYYQFTLSP